MTVAEEKEARRLAKNKELEKRKQQAEKAVKSTSGLLSGTASAIAKRNKLLKNL